MYSESNDETNNRQLVISPSIARELLRLGYKIVDLQPDKMNPEKSVFVFKRSEKLLSTLTALIEKRKLERKIRYDLWNECDNNGK